MFKKILYPTDFSEVSGKALTFIKQLKEAGTQEVVVLHVIDERELASALQHLEGGLPYQDEIEKVMEKNADEGTKATQAELKQAGFQVKTRIEKGIPFKEILRVEEEEGVSIIVIGSHGKSNVGEMLLGSVSEKVVRKSKKPVLVIKR
jgi:nucleotide-binding universal stress UspA family protein